MDGPIKMRLVFVPLMASAFLALAACGQADQANEDVDQAAENGLENFVPNGPETVVAETEVAAPETTETADVTVNEAPAGFAPESAVPDPTSAMSHNLDDTGEDMFQRGFYDEAIEQWRVDAEAGDSYAAYRLGIEYFDGQVIERDFEMAARYHQLASDLGNPAAMFELASFYEAGLGLDQNIMEAAAWYLESAQRGFPPSQHNVATMFEEGAGVEQDFVQAYLFYSLAIEQGFRVNYARDEATGEGILIDPRDQLRGMMTPEEIADAEAAFEAFVPVE